MTLLHVCGRYLPLSETFTYDLITGLAGFEHHVVAASIENLQHFPLPNVTVPQPEAQAFALATRIGARAVVCHFGPQATIGMPIALAIDRPAVTIFHGYDISRLLRDGRWVERYLAAAGMGMQALCISDAGRRRLIEIGWPVDQIDVVHLGVDTARFTFNPPAQRWGTAGPHRILMVGRLVQKKGVDVALDAMAMLQARGQPLDLRIIGDGPERERFESLIAERRLTNVSLLGALEHERTRQEFAEADLYIQPSITANSGDQEGIPVALMEAMASGLPVVSTRHSGIPELVLDGHTGLLTDEGDAEGLAAALMHLVGDRDRAQQFAEAGRAHVLQEFDRDHQTRRFSAYLSALAGDVTRRPGVYLSRRPTRRRRGLVIRSIPLGLFARKMSLLCHRHPDVRWDVLTTRSSAHDVARMKLVSTVRVYDEGRLSLRRIGLDTLRDLQECNYDLVVALYGDETGAAFANVRRTVATIGGRRRLALTLGDRERPLPVAPVRLHLTRPSLLSSAR